MKKFHKALIASLAILALGASAAYASSITNGDFETRNFKDWKIRNTGGGNWIIYDKGNRKMTKPRGGATLPKPYGTFAASIVQGNPSTNYIIRTLEVPADATMLSVKLFWINQGSPPPTITSAQASEVGFWRFPGEWSVSAGRIQYFTLDLVKPSADGFSTKKSDVLATIFKPKINSTQARSGGWVTETVNVEKYQGQKIKFRLVEADNSGYMNVGLDNLTFNVADLPTG